MLLERERECAAIERLLEEAHAGRSGALVVRGEAGIGKTALLDFAIERASDMLLVRAQGVQSEAEVAFGGLLHVCRPLLAKADDLPERQAHALRTALALGPAAAPPDRLAVGAATLSLLGAAAEDAPLLVTVDDAQWLDAESADAIAFAGRRLHAERVALVLAVREGEGRGVDTSGLEEMRLTGLSADATAALLAASGLGGEARADQLHALTGGNPLALLELPLPVGEGAMIGPAVEPVLIGERLQAAFGARAEALPDRTRDALLVLAASGTEDAASIAAALVRVGLSVEDLAPAEDAGLIRITLAELPFRHPLVRSAVYSSAARSERRRVHAVLADALEQTDPDSAAWHCAAAATGPDEAVAAGLERAADRSAARGGASAASAAYETAARLSPSRRERARRLHLAARQAWVAGQAARARTLAEEAQDGADERLRAELLYLGGEIEQLTGHPAAAHRMLLEAAALTASRDSTRGALMLCEAADVSLHLGHDAYDAIVEAFDTFSVPPGGVGEFRRQIALSQAAMYRGNDSYFEHVRAAARLLDEGGVLLESARDLVWAGRAYWSLADYEPCRRFGDAAVSRSRASALGMLPEALRLAAMVAHVTGRWNAAHAAASEAVEVASALGQHMISCAVSALLAGIAAARGQSEACHAHAEEATRLANEFELGFYRLRAERALALLAIGRGQLGGAIDVLAGIRQELADAGNREFFISPAPDLIEALVRAGREQETEGVLREVELLAEPDHGEQAILERCRGLLARNGFEQFFETALGHHAMWDNPFELARTELCYGERLRRAGRRRDARDPLRTALARFEQLAAVPWAARAAAELRATGETVRRRDPTEQEELTPQELQIAIHAAEGKSNRDIGATLFLSARTVEFHLTRVYRKLNIHSRAELIRRFSTEHVVDADGEVAHR
jgi:DNA-binding CsgD family transcriptional regulator